jgi:ribonuclease HII
MGSMSEQMLLAVQVDETVGFRAFEEKGYTQGFKRIAGIDEVGRGPLAGPVIAAAVVLRPEFTNPEIKDSKLLSVKQREILAPLIRENAADCAIGIVGVDEIDRLNIHQASLLAMVKAIAGMALKPDYMLIDGNQSIPAHLFRVAEFSPGIKIYQKTIIKGDRLCLSIAAASVVAKVARDAIMLEYDKQYPEYGFAQHKGYGCEEHLDVLRRYGPSPIHRQSFKPVRKASPQQKNYGPLFEP